MAKEPCSDPAPLPLERIYPGWWLVIPASARPFVLRVENPDGFRHSHELAHAHFLFLHDLDSFPSTTTTPEPQ